MAEIIFAILALLLIAAYYVRLLSDKTDYKKIREIVKEEIQKLK